MLLFQKHFASKRQFGVEFEVGSEIHKDDIGKLIKGYESKRLKTRPVRVEGGKKGWAESHDNNYWHVKYDSTCGVLGKGSDNGWEIASFVASGFDDLDWISTVAERLHSDGIKTNPNCGMHIHADVRDFSQSQIGDLFSRWLRCEKLMLQSVPSHRRNNKYCRQIYRLKPILRKTTFSGKSLWSKIQPTSYYPHENEQKKITLNPMGFAEFLHTQKKNRPTIEYRLPECLLNKQHVLYTAVLFLNFVESSRLSSRSVDYNEPVSDRIKVGLQDLGLYSDQEDYHQICEGVLLDAKIWFLKSIVNNARFESYKIQARKYLRFLESIL